MTAFFATRTDSSSPRSSFMLCERVLIVAHKVRVVLVNASELGLMGGTRQYVSGGHFDIYTLDTMSIMICFVSVF